MTPRRYGPLAYLPITRRPKLTWPGGARVALWVNPNIEFFGLDDVMPGNLNELVPREHAKIPNVRNWAIVIAPDPTVDGLKAWRNSSANGAIQAGSRRAVCLARMIFCSWVISWSPFLAAGGRVAVPARGENRALSPVPFRKPTNVRLSSSYYSSGRPAAYLSRPGNPRPASRTPPVSPSLACDAVLDDDKPRARDSIGGAGRRSRGSLRGGPRSTVCETPGFMLHPSASAARPPAMTNVLRAGAGE